MARTGVGMEKEVDAVHFNTQFPLQSLDHRQKSGFVKMGSWETALTQGIALLQGRKCTLRVSTQQGGCYLVLTAGGAGQSGEVEAHILCICPPAP